MIDLKICNILMDNTSQKCIYGILSVDIVPLSLFLSNFSLFKLLNKCNKSLNSSQYHLQYYVKKVTWCKTKKMNVIFY